MESRILAACLKSRKAWESLKDSVGTAELAPDTTLLLGLITDYYTTDSAANSVDTELLVPKLSRKVQNKSQLELLKNFLLNPPETSPENVLQELNSMRRNDAGLRLAVALQRESEDLNTIKSLLGKYSDLIGSASSTGSSEDEDIRHKFAVTDLLEKSFDPKGLIPILPKRLNDMLGGGCRPGHHILVFGPTEIAKTLIVLNMLAGWAVSDIPCLYVGNEDPVEDLMMRYINRLTLMPKHEVLKDPAKAQSLLERRKYENVIFAPLAPGNFDTIQRLVTKFQPRVVVLDQLRNIDVDSDNRTQALEKAATEARNLAKRNKLLVVSVSQAADSASGKRILNRGDVDSSNVGIPGQVDLMLGVGATEEDEKMNVRYLSFPKNKVSGNHDGFPIRIDPMLSRVLEE